MISCHSQVIFNTKFYNCTVKKSPKIISAFAGCKIYIMSDYRIIKADEVNDAYEGSDVPGEFRSLTDALGAEQVAITLIRVPPNSDFEQGTGHYHKDTEEIYLITRGTLTMRLGDDIKKVSAGSVVRVAPKTPRSHRNEENETVDMWAISRKNGHDATKIDDFWEASEQAKQHK